MDVVKFALAVMTYAMRTQASVTSWGRTPRRQAELDPSVKFSPHVYWVGADVVYDGGQAYDYEEIAVRLGLKLIHEADHDHLQPLEWKAG